MAALYAQGCERPQKKKTRRQSVGAARFWRRSGVFSWLGDLLLHLEERGDASSIHELQLIGQETIDVGGAIGVEDEHVVEFLTPGGQEWKPLQLDRRYLIQGQVHVINRRAIHRLQVAIRFLDRNRLLGVLRENVGPKSVTVQQHEGREMPVGRREFRQA